jgi:2-polyprenyl-3-methyl-5-hydroxy-6-metoxy-1,4-benzoquinol methylase
MYQDKADLISREISKQDEVLDVGFSGQALQAGTAQYPHKLLQQAAKDVYGVDLYLPEGFNGDHYLKANAEDFDFKRTFDVVVAFDLIEHLSNPGLFLACCKRHLKPGGKIILTTPNAFNLFSLAEKITHREPNVNPDHTFYFNKPTLDVLLKKNGLRATRWDAMYDMLGNLWEGGIKRKLLAVLYACTGAFTDKFAMTMVVFVGPQ